MKTITNICITLAFAANLIPMLPLYAMSHTPEHNQQNQHNQEDEETKKSAQNANQQLLSDEQQTLVNNTLIEAIGNNNAETVRTALAARANINVRHVDYDCLRTPLMIAAESNYLSLVTMLLTYKADVHIMYEFMTPLDVAIDANDCPELVNVLLEHNAPVNGYTTTIPPLVRASHYNRIKIVKTLLCAGADVSLIGLNGVYQINSLCYNKTAFECARSDEMRAAFAKVPQTKKEAKEAIGTLQELLIQQILENNFLPVTSVSNLTLDYAVPYIDAVEYYFLNESVAEIWNTIKKVTQVTQKKAAQATQASQSTPYSAAAAMPTPQPLLMTPLMDTEEDEKEQASEQVISATNTVPTPSMPESFRASAYRNALQWQETRVAAENGLQAPPTPNENGFYDSDPE